MGAEALVTQFNPRNVGKVSGHTVGQNENFTFNFIKLVLDLLITIGLLTSYAHLSPAWWQPDFFLAETISVPRRNILEFASLRHIIKRSWMLQIRSNMFQESNNAFSRSS